LTRFLLALLIGLLAFAGAACGSDDEEAPAGSADATATAAPADACATDELPLVEPGTLTVGTDKPAFPPYFEDDDPTNGKGFESAVAYAIADKLGFSEDEVKWTVVPFNSSYAPGPEEVRFRHQPDLDHPQASRARRLLDALLHGAAGRAGAEVVGGRVGRVTGRPRRRQARRQVGTTSLDAVTEVIKPSQQPQVFNDSNDTVRALKAKRVDAIVTDLPTAFYLSAAEVPEAKISGQFDAPGGDDWGSCSRRTPSSPRA
jgi:polar amino acid transport system substrate-binding protein